MNPDLADAVSTYFETVQGNEIPLDDERQVKILRGGVKERKGKYTLIFRYQLMI